MSAHWSAGVLVGLPFVVLAVAALLLCAWLLRRKSDAMRSRDPYDERRWVQAGSWACLALTVALLALLVSPIGYWPFKTEYHQWRPVSGTVTQVSSRIISDGNQSVNQRFVVRFAEHDSFYGCDDTRCATVKVGDHLSLSCKREWQYASVSGYGCRWLS